MDASSMSSRTDNCPQGLTVSIWRAGTKNSGKRSGRQIVPGLARRRPARVTPRAAFLPDTSCMIAAVCAWHDHHRATTAELDRRIGRRERLAVAAPALIEAFAVLTRLPPPHRLGASDALAVLEANFVHRATVVALRGAHYVKLLRQAAG